ncbi:hypothetical protein H6G41_33250 [Tolypothrix sp. FACHB-123]|uniref:hypothetical protein n=1 Tax=Tolypothrix sp. FACHB-123 TaxID=2692868 RepID=UPI001686675B|nr:hypothetical protein [Tolypothrix sp. FACHB-123]MBD2359391.1 hypothetical protein [Tolypothrix sp. FACHB-123]
MIAIALPMITGTLAIRAITPILRGNISVGAIALIPTEWINANNDTGNRATILA